MHDAHAWLDARAETPPGQLRERIDAALNHTACFSDGAMTVHLAEAALHALADATADCDARDSAIALLAADALLTYAFEAAAEQGGEAVAAVIDAYGNHRLAALLQHGASMQHFPENG